MKLVSRLEEMFNKFMGEEVYYRDSTIKAVISKIVNKDIDEINAGSEVYILLKAMVNAAKAGGEVDEVERKKIMEFMGDMSKVQQMFVEYEFNKQFNLHEFVKEVPQGMEEQVYYMSLFAIDLNETEREYLELLANKLNLAYKIVDGIHESLEPLVA